MSQHSNASQIYSTFLNLLKELEDFADTRDLKLAFDREEKVYLIGDGFADQLQSNFALYREVNAEMRGIIAKRCTRIHPSL